MNRKENKEFKTNKIIKVATKLFINNGYENTSVRQILNETGIGQGSLYNFFNDKEEILLCVFKNIHEELMALTQKIANDFEEPILGIFTSAATEKMAMFESNRVKNIYRFMWSVKPVKDYILPHRVANTKKILKSFRLKFTEEEIYARILASMGVEKALGEAIIDGSTHIEPEEVWIIQTRMYLASFGVSNIRINKVIQNVLNIIEKKGNKYKKSFIRKLANSPLK